MKFFYVILVISLVGCDRIQSLHASESEDQQQFFYANEEPDDTENTVNYTFDSETVDHRLGTGQSAPHGSSCTIPLFAVNKTETVIENSGEKQMQVTLQKKSLTNAVLVMNGHFLLTAADLVKNTQKQLVVKQNGDSLVQVSRIILINGTNIALLKLCRKVTTVSPCRILPKEFCTTSTCSAVPPSITSHSFTKGGIVNATLETSITHLKGRTVPCPANLGSSSSCCFTSNQTLCQGNKGAGIFSGLNVFGIITANYTCQPQSAYAYTPIQGEITQKIFYGVVKSLDCVSCKKVPQTAPQILTI